MACFPVTQAWSNNALHGAEETYWDAEEAQTPVAPRFIAVPGVNGMIRSSNSADPAAGRRVICVGSIEAEVIDNGLLHKNSGVLYMLAATEYRRIGTILGYVIGEKIPGPWTGGGKPLDGRPE